MERLIITPAATPGSFNAHLESSGLELIRSSRQPLVDGARALLKLGFDPDTPLTMRHAGKAYDSFDPLPIGEWAKLTYEERPNGPKAVPWKPFPEARKTQK